MVDALEWYGPSPRLLQLRLGEVTAAAALPFLIGLILPIALGETLLGVAIALAVLVVAVAAALIVFRRVRAWSYAERDDDLLVQRGVMFRRLSVVPYGRMQFVDVVAGPLERSVGLATVHMHTAAAASDARIPGLLVAEANRLRDQLAALGEAQAAGI
jgi:membrane protein YdbS with pleckstrin-like domain